MIYEVYKTVLIIANKEHYGEITPARFGYLAINAQNKAFYELLSVYRRSFSKYQNDKEKRAMIAAWDRFYESAELAKEGTNTFFILPSDYALEDTVYFGDTPVTIQDKQKTGIIKTHRLLKATKSEPLGEIRGSHMFIYPMTIGQRILKTDNSYIYPKSITFNYYRYPKPCGLELDDNGNVLPYSDSDFELPEFFFNKLVVYILEQIGINLREESVYQFANQEQVQGIQTENL